MKTIGKYREIILEGRPWKLNLGLHALVEFEERIGENAGSVFEPLLPQVKGEKGLDTMRRFIKNFSAKKLATLFYCMLLKFHKEELTFEEAADMITPDVFADVFAEMQALTEAVAPKPSSVGNGEEANRPFAETEPIG